MNGVIWFNGKPILLKDFIKALETQAEQQKTDDETESSFYLEVWTNSLDIMF